MFVIYKKDTKRIINAAFTKEDAQTDLNVDEDFVVMDENEYEKTLTYDYGTAWFLKDDGSVENREYKEELSQEDLNTIEKYELEDFLANTDYIITKLNELRIEDDDSYESEKEKYKDILEQRKYARKRIGELSDEK